MTTAKQQTRQPHDRRAEHEFHNFWQIPLARIPRDLPTLNNPSIQSQTHTHTHDMGTNTYTSPYSQGGHNLTIPSPPLPVYSK